MNVVLDNKTTNWRKVFAFLLKLAVIWLSWKVVFYLTGEEKVPVNDRLFPALSAQWENINNIMRSFVLQCSEHLLNMLGYTTENDGYILRIKGQRGLGIGNYCLCFQLIYFFSVLVIISGLSKKCKLLAILTGVSLVILLNVIRIVILCVIVVHRTALLPVFHDYIFNTVVIAVLLACYLFLMRHVKE